MNAHVLQVQAVNV